MLRSNRYAAVGIALTVAFSVWSIASTDALAQHMHQHGGQSGKQHAMHAAEQHDTHDGQQHPGLSPANMAASPFARPTPHGGQMSVADPFRFEVVYWPQELRVYLYDASSRPISARGIEGQVALTVRGYEEVYRYPLKHVASRAGSHSQDHLGLAINLSRIKDGEMSVALEITNLPSQQRPKATLTQVFALSKIPVVLAALGNSDRPRIEQQKVCAVAGSPLGSMGTPVKVLVGDHSIYLCCKGCLGKVQQNPEAYLPKATPTHTGHVASAGNGAAMTNELTVSTSTSADQAAIRAQQVCAVAGSRLGGMGTPVKVTMNGQSLFLCCKACLGKVEKDPAGYFAKAAELRTGH